ncbi:MAG: hypothetical protein Q8N99_00045 [Nanoarchaeota archaeon]|nr:hypothetical protein [Nanoarchaeota archaeon]
MEELNESDVEVLWRLSGIYEALTHSAVSPVVICEYPEEAVLGGKYYDAWDDKEKALEIMKRRIELASEDIREHHSYHGLFLEHLISIDASIGNNDRQAIGNSANELCETVSVYMDFVEEHRKRLVDNAFLYYPNCPCGHYFHIQSYSMEPRELFFNPAASKFFGNIHLRKIKRLLHDFIIRQENLPLGAKVASQTDSGEGIMDTSLRGRIALNQELLKRIDFVF